MLFENFEKQAWNTTKRYFDIKRFEFRIEIYDLLQKLDNEIESIKIKIKEIFIKRSENNGTNLIFFDKFIYNEFTLHFLILYIIM